MLIILEHSRKAHLLQQCYTALANSLTMEHLLEWGLSAADPLIISRQMVDWAVLDSVAAQIVEEQYADNSGDESGGGRTPR